MTEGQFNSKLVKMLKMVMADCVVWKFADRYTGGIPDFCIVTPRGDTTWFESKILGEKQTALQDYYFRRLAKSCLVIWDPKKSEGHLTYKDEVISLCLPLPELVKKIDYFARHWRGQ